MKKLTIEREEYTYECGDQYCFEQGESVTINGELVIDQKPFFSLCEDSVEMICEYLGVEVEWV